MSLTPSDRRAALVAVAANNLNAASRVDECGTQGVDNRKNKGFGPSAAHCNFCDAAKVIGWAKPPADVRHNVESGIDPLCAAVARFSRMYDPAERPSDPKKERELQ